MQRAFGGVTITNEVVRVEIGQGSLNLVNLSTGYSIGIDLEVAKIPRAAQPVVPGWLAPRSDIDGRPPILYSSGKDKQAVIEIEEEGPVRAVVRVRGQFTRLDGRSTFSRYDYRLYVYERSGIVRWQPTWIFDGYAATDVIGHIEAVISNAVPAGAQPVAGILDAAGKAQTVPVSDFIVQESTREFRTPAGATPGQLSGWFTASGTRKATGASVAVKEFWQNYPSGFEVRAQTLRVGLWPGASAFALDLARTSDGSGDGEHGADLQSDAHGLAKTFDLLLSVNSTRDSFATVATVFEQELLFYPGSRYMTGTEAIGPIAYHDPEGFPRMEGFYSALIHWGMENRKRFDWFGFIDYGDIRTNIETKDWNSWRTAGRYGWRNGALDVSNAMLIHYLRTGDPVAWKMGAPYARHITDIDTVHHERPQGGQPVGAMHRRGQDHWSGMTQSQYTYTQGPFLYHYLSGDPRVRSVLLEEVAKWQSRPDQAWASNAAETTVRAWEATGDPDWLNTAKAQMQRHLKPDAYNNFRFALDYVPALVQYARLSGDPKAEAILNQRTDWLLDAPNWAYFQTHLATRDKRMMLAADRYHKTGNSTKYLKYPSLFLANAMPPAPPEPETWDWQTLHDYLRALPNPPSESTHWNEIGYGPYFLGALQKAGWDEQTLQTLPTLYGTRAATRISGTAADVGQSTRNYTNGWDFLPLPPTADALQQSAADIAAQLRGLPGGAVIYVNNIPFKLAAADAPAGEKLLVLADGSDALIHIPEGASALHLLGPMLTATNWNEGEAVIRYALQLDNGETKEGQWRNLLDFDDYRGFHIAEHSAPGRFWQSGSSARVHADVVTIPFDGQAVRSIRLRDTGNKYTSFILAATAQMQERDTPAPIASIVFGDDSGSASDKDSGGNDSGNSDQTQKTQTFSFDAQTPRADTTTGSGWLLSDSETKALRFADRHVASTGTIALQVPLANGDYLVDLQLRNASVLGGVLEIDVNGNTLPPVSVSGGKGDRIEVPASVSEGRLQIYLSSLPALHSTPLQTPLWQLQAVQIFPLPLGNWSLRKGTATRAVIDGELVGTRARYSQSVGSTHQYHFWNMDKLTTTDGEYRVDFPKFPQDVILDFDSPVEMTGVWFVPLDGYGPNEVTLQVREPGSKTWQTLKTWSLPIGSAGVREALEPKKISAARFLMPTGNKKQPLRLLRADIFGKPL